MSERTIILFRSVNRRGLPGYRAGLQRHHLIPRQVLTMPCFSKLVLAMGVERYRLFDDFRHNGLLLPANDDTAMAMRLPLHRGPHRVYSTLVSERFGVIEAYWARRRLGAEEVALREALFRLHMLQRALRRRLLSIRQPLTLNQRSRLNAVPDYSALDAMANCLWSATEPSST